MDLSQAAALGFGPLLVECFRQAASPPDTPGAAQQLVQLLDLAQARASALHLVTPGEDTVREVRTKALRSLFIPSLQSLALARVPTHLDHSARKRTLQLAQTAATRFLGAVEQLHILAPGTHALVQSVLPSSSEAGQNTEAQKGQPGSYSPSASAAQGGRSTGDALAQSAKRRQSKIARFQTERALRRSLETFRGQADASARFRGRHSGCASDVMFDAYFLSPRKSLVRGSQATNHPNSSKYHDDDDDDGGDDEDDDASGKGAGQDHDDGTENSEDEADEDEDEGEDEDEETREPGGPSDGVPRTVRGYLLVLLNLHALRCASDIESAQQELDLLSSIPSTPPTSAPPPKQDTEWRLDAASGQTGPLLDTHGRPLRPFTLTSTRGGGGTGAAMGSAGKAPGTLGAKADLSARQRLAAEVFRPSHRLPSMTVDEYLAEEMRRGNVISGGGPSQMEEPTPREDRALRAERDGTREADEADEEARREAINWDTFKEQHRKGEGNTMNRG